LHCHIFAHSHMSMDTHPEGESGMTGMVLILNVVPSGSSLPASTGLPARSVPIGSSTPIGDPSRLGLIAALAVFVLVGLRTGRRRLVPIPLAIPQPPRKDQTR